MPLDWSKVLELVYFSEGREFVVPNIKVEWVENLEGKRVVGITQYKNFDENGQMEICLDNPLGTALVRNKKV